MYEHMYVHISIYLSKRGFTNKVSSFPSLVIIPAIMLQTFYIILADLNVVLNSIVIIWLIGVPERVSHIVAIAVLV